MPSKNIVKLYIENGHYHVYNRGADRRTIFKDEKDYRVFLNLLKTYLSPQDSNSKHPLARIIVRPRPLPCFYGKVELQAFCLMPNHFHLLIKQAGKMDMANFMRSLCTTYSMYFNKRYNRPGTLFQSKYKAALIETDPYLLHLSRYIHLNPKALTGSDPVTKTYSSYPYYLGSKNALWVNPEPILEFFKTAQSTSLQDCLSYQSFVEEYSVIASERSEYQKDSGEILGDLVIEKD